MTIYPESWMYTAAAEDAIANAVEAGYKWTECHECGGKGFWCKDGETLDCPLCGAKIDGPMSEANIQAMMDDAGWTDGLRD